jgi:hypothetical protein
VRIQVTASARAEASVLIAIRDIERYLPSNTGARFSKKAVNPSR